MTYREPDFDDSEDEAQPNRKTYRVGWDNGHACDTFSDVFTSKWAAVRFARAWKREMVAMDENPREAREAYSWEIVCGRCDRTIDDCRCED